MATTTTTLSHYTVVVTSLVLFFICESRCSNVKVALELSLSKAICKQVGDFSTRQKLQSPLKDMDKFPDQKCGWVLWNQCNTERDKNCRSQFQTKDCKPGEVLDANRPILTFNSGETGPIEILDFPPHSDEGGAPRPIDHKPSSTIIFPERIPSQNGQRPPIDRYPEGEDDETILDFDENSDNLDKPADPPGPGGDDDDYEPIIDFPSSDPGDNPEPKNPPEPNSQEEDYLSDEDNNEIIDFPPHGEGPVLKPNPDEDSREKPPVDDPQPSNPGEEVKQSGEGSFIDIPHQNGGHDPNLNPGERDKPPGPNSRPRPPPPPPPPKPRVKGGGLHVSKSLATAICAQRSAQKDSGKLQPVLDDKDQYDDGSISCGWLRKDKICPKNVRACQFAYKPCGRGEG